jgi:hypothetical protein
MGLTNPESVDLIVKMPNAERGVALIIADDGSIADETSRETALRRKLATYMHFIASGQLVEHCPEDRGAAVTIVVCSQTPTEGMLQIEAVRNPASPDVAIPVEVITPLDLERWLAQAG